MKTRNNIYMLLGSDSRRYILSDHLEATSLLIDFMNQVLKTKATYYRSILVSNGRCKSIRSAIANHLPRLRQYARLFNPSYSFDPALRFFFEQYRQHAIKNYADACPNELMHDGRAVSALFDDFLGVMRERAKEAKLVKAVADWRSKSTKNLKRALAIESELFTRHGRVGVIRIDLAYRAAIFSPEEIEQHMAEVAKKKLDTEDALYWSSSDLESAAPMEGRVSFEEVQLDRKRLFANMKGKPSLFEHLLGYVTRIECSPLAGYHMHLVLFFNGAKVQQLDWLAQQIGEYWVERITKGRGRFHNCNRDWNEKHPNYGIGMINHDEDVKRANLREKVLAYLCKADQSVEVLPYKGCNLFSAEILHRGRAKGRGRKRTKGALGGRMQPSHSPQDIQDRPSSMMTST